MVLSQASQKKSTNCTLIWVHQCNGWLIVDSSLPSGDLTALLHLLHVYILRGLKTWGFCDLHPLWWSCAWPACHLSRCWPSWTLRSHRPLPKKFTRTHGPSISTEERRKPIGLQKSMVSLTTAKWVSCELYALFVFAMAVISEDHLVLAQVFPVCWHLVIKL